MALTKRYGDHAALDGLTLSVPECSVFGFLGSNGAGKTTTLRILLGFARPTSGHARILGADIAAAPEREIAATRARIGYLPDVTGCYPSMRASDVLRFAGSLFGVRGTVLDERVDSLLALAGLRGVEQRVGGFSRGMRQRLGNAQALVGAPDLLLLDEPTSALDPLGRMAVLDMIDELRGRTTVFFSTHILPDVERVCDRVAVLDRGRLVAADTVDGLRGRRGGTRVAITVAAGADRLADALGHQAGVTAVAREDNTLARLHRRRGCRAARRARPWSPTSGSAWCASSRANPRSRTSSSRWCRRSATRRTARILPPSTGGAVGCRHDRIPCLPGQRTARDRLDLEAMGPARGLRLLRDLLPDPGPADQTPRRGRGEPATRRRPCPSRRMPMPTPSGSRTSASSGCSSRWSPSAVSSAPNAAAEGPFSRYANR